ncbi:MAG: DMT family transporter [Alphaproteobacteria bacterium]|nr:DMT family transporter [Alphaproteobacteria bacterium]
MSYLLAVLMGFVYAFQKVNDKRIISKLKIDYVLMGLYRNLVPLLFLTIPLLFFNQVHYLSNGLFLFYVFLLSILNISKTLLYYRALKKFDISYITVLNASTPLLMALMGVLFLKETFSLLNVLGMFVVVSGTVLLELSRVKRISRFHFRRSGWLLVVLIMILSSLIGVVSKKAILEGSVISFIWSIYFIMFLFFMFFYKVRHKNVRKILNLSKKHAIPLVFTGFLLTIAVVLQMYSYKFLPIGKVAGIGSIELVVIFMLEYMFIKNKFNKIRALSAAIILSGIALLIF